MFFESKYGICQLSGTCIIIIIDILRILIIVSLKVHYMYCVFCLLNFIMPPTLIKLEGHIAFGLSVCVWVGGCVC